MNKVLFLNSEYNGVAYWRVFEPARFLNMHYKDIAVTYFPHKSYTYKLRQEFEQLAKIHDLIVASRISDQEALAVFLTIREISGKPIIMECDDDWRHVDKENFAYKEWHKESYNFKYAEKQSASADGYQLSTFPLKQNFYKFGGNKPAWISPNLIDIDKMDGCFHNALQKRKQRKNIRIGWAGGGNHYGDFLNSGVLEALEVIAVKYPDTEFLFKGMVTDFFTEDKTIFKDNPGKSRIIKPAFTDPKRITTEIGCEFWDWPQAIADMDLDIVIVPLNDTKFNKSKSNCRYLEFSSIKVPGVYSDCYPYSNTITHGEDGYLAKNKDDWIKYLSMLIEDAQLRRNIAKNAYQTVNDKYSLQNNIGIWKQNLDEMVDYANSTTFVSYVR